MKPDMKKLKRMSPLLEISAIHGLVYLTLEGKKRYGWLLIMVCNLMFTVYLIAVIKDRFDSSLIYTRVDGTCRVNQVPFPSVSICNANTISQRETRNIRRILSSHKRNDTEIDAFFEALFQLTQYASPNVGHFPEVMRILESHYFNVDSIMEESLKTKVFNLTVGMVHGFKFALRDMERAMLKYCMIDYIRNDVFRQSTKVHQQCENLLLHCEFNGVVLKCGELFQHIKTVEGYCCAFNNVAVNENVDEYDVLSEHNDEIEVYDRRETHEEGFIISTSKSGRASGLTVLFDVQPQDYPHWSKTLFYGAKVLISDPSDYPETTLTTAYAELGCSLNLLIEPMIYLSEPIIRRVPQELRQCLFHDEMNLASTDSYTFETCHTECNIKKYLQFCGCIPYKYQRELSSRVCGLTDVPCMHQLLVSDVDTDCLCAHECSDRKYKVTQHKKPLTEDRFPSKLIRKVNLSEVAAVSVFYDKPTCNCYKKTLLLDIARLVGTYGGVFSLSLGASIVSAVEICCLVAGCCMRKARRVIAALPSGTHCFEKS